MKSNKLNRYGIPKKACFLFIDENEDPITKVWIWRNLVFYKNYTKDNLKRSFGKKRIVLMSDVQRFLCSRSIPESRNMKIQELMVYGLTNDASHWEIVKALGGRTIADGCSIRFFYADHCMD